MSVFCHCAKSWVKRTPTSKVTIFTVKSEKTCSHPGPIKTVDRANHYRAVTPLALVCDATTRVRFPVDEGATIGKSRGSISPPDVGVETWRAHSPVDRESTHRGVVSAFLGSTYFRRTGTAPLGVFFGRSALRVTSANRAAAGLEIASCRGINQSLASASGPGWEQVVEQI